jgi:ribosome maturation factor RimP
MKETESDPTIDEIREVRHRISARFDHDPAKLVAYYMELQKQYKDRLFRPQKVAEQIGRKTA